MQYLMTIFMAVPTHGGAIENALIRYRLSVRRVSACRTRTS